MLPTEHLRAPEDRSALTRQIVLYVVLAYSFSCLPYALVVHAGRLDVGNGLSVALLMWCPALAAFAACRLLGIGVGTLGWRWPGAFVLKAYLLPIGYALPVYVATWLAVRGSFGFAEFATRLGAAFGFPKAPYATTWLIAVPCYASVGVIRSMASALGEEIGWRGFLLPRLVARAGFTRGCFVSGIVWALWHYPALLLADYNAGTPKLYALGCFTLMVFGAAFVFGWFRLRSGSLWPAAMLHASHNLFIQAVFDRCTNPVGKSLYITTEFGCGLALTIGACAVYLWTRREEAVRAAETLSAAPAEASLA